MRNSDCGIRNNRLSSQSSIPQFRTPQCPGAVCFLLHFPARWRPGPGSPNRYRGWALPTTAPCGARTFLPGQCFSARCSSPSIGYRVGQALLHCTRAPGTEALTQRRPSGRPTDPSHHRIAMMRTRRDARRGPRFWPIREIGRKIAAWLTVSLDWHEYPPPGLTGGAVTVGNFDGVHRGHQALVAAARRQADAVRGPAVAVTFDPPPHRVLHPDSGPPRPPLTTLADRAELLQKAGADHVVILRTSPALLALSPEAFFEDILVRQLGAKAVVEGYDFRFGRGRAGPTDALRTLCAASGLGFEEVPPLHCTGASRCRAAACGRPSSAGTWHWRAELLGRPYRIAGTVVEGRGVAAPSGSRPRTSPTCRRCCRATGCTRCGQRWTVECGRGGERRPEPDLRRGRPEGRGPPDRLRGRRVRPTAGGRVRRPAARHAAVRRRRAN